MKLVLRFWHALLTFNKRNDRLHHQEETLVIPVYDALRKSFQLCQLLRAGKPLLHLCLFIVGLYTTIGFFRTSSVKLYHEERRLLLDRLPGRFCRRVFSKIASLAREMRK